MKLAEKYGVDVHRAEVAGLLHDCTKKLSMPEQLALCEKYGIALDELEKKALKRSTPRPARRSRGTCSAWTMKFTMRSSGTRPESRT